MLARTKVLWFGDFPEPKIIAEFENRGLSLISVTARNYKAHLVDARGSVYQFKPENISKIRAAFNATSKASIDHGLLLFLLAENDMIQGHIQNYLKTKDIQMELLVLRTAPTSDYEIAEKMRSYDPGPPCVPSIEIIEQGVSPPLDSSELLLLRRAFYECSRIVLKSLSGGKTARAFVVYATFRDSIVGPSPLPFFAKLGLRKKIQDEKAKYRQYATHFIPFYLCPNLDFELCISGCKKAVLVGRFVDKSESLSELIRRGHGHSAIHSLFDATLHGWRVQAYEPDRDVTIGSVAAGFRAGLFDHSCVKKSHLKLAKKFGVNTPPIKLWESLIGLSNQKFRTAPMHGDLHGDNVRVRGSDAIIIDLASVCEGPLAGDPASLEAWVAFEAPPDQTLRNEDSEWRSIIDELYKPEYFVSLPASRNEPMQDCWLWNSVRQIRMMALPIQSCDSEYQTALAVYLLRRTMWKGDNELDDFRRGYAYVIASRIIGYLRERDTL